MTLKSNFGNHGFSCANTVVTRVTKMFPYALMGAGRRKFVGVSVLKAMGDTKVRFNEV